MLAALESHPPAPLAGFIHVPHVDVLPVESVVRAMHVVIDVVGTAVRTR